MMAESKLRAGEGKQIPSPRLSNKHRGKKKQKNVLLFRICGIKITLKL